MVLESIGAAMQQAEDQRLQEVGSSNTVLEQLMQSLNKQRDRANQAERERDGLQRELQYERFLRQQCEEALADKEAMIDKQKSVNEGLYAENAESAREKQVLKQKLQRARAELNELQASFGRLNQIASALGQLSVFPDEVDTVTEDTLVVNE